MSAPDPPAVFWQPFLPTSSPTSWSRCLLKTSKAAHEKVWQSDLRYYRMGDRNHHLLSDFLDDDHGFQNRTGRLFARPDLHADPRIVQGCVRAKQLSDVRAQFHLRLDWVDSDLFSLCHSGRL